MRNCPAGKLTVGLLLLLAGGLLYLLYRPQVLLLFRLVSWMGLDGVVGGWREAATVLTLPEWVVYSLPAGLWAASYVLIIDSVTADKSSGHDRLTPKCQFLAVSIVPDLGVASELMQAAALLPGTFDWLDLLFYALPLGMVKTSAGPLFLTVTEISKKQIL